MKKLLLAAACLMLIAPGARASTTITVLNEGSLFHSIEFANTLGGRNQDPVKCAASTANHHTHGPLPGEGHDASGWCDAIQFRTFSVTVPTTDPDGRPVSSGTLNIALHFASGDEPPTDQFPAQESQRGYTDAELAVSLGTVELANTLNAPGWTAFQSPHVISVPVQIGNTYTLVVDPFAGVHNEWHLDATLTLN